jgi:hypothetical protein
MHSLKELLCFKVQAQRSYAEMLALYATRAVYILALPNRCDIVPLCRGDLVIGSNSQKGSSSKLAGALAIVHKVTSVVQLIDPTTLTW